MSASQNEEQQLKTGLRNSMEQFYQANQTLETLKVQLRQQEMTCFMAEKIQCVQTHDRFRLTLAALNRERESELEMCMDRCKSMLPASLVGKDFTTSALSSSTDLKAFREFASCHNACVTEGTKTLEKVQEEVRKTISQVTAFTW